MLVEVCVDHANMASQAASLGAQRVELCAHLDAGGITPSAGMVLETVTACAPRGCRVHVMIRPRPGDFVYEPAELRMMSRDIEMAARLGVNGVVFGLLTPARTIDAQRVWEFVEQAHALKMQVTFHRAFDLCPDASSAVDMLITCGVDHLLTSGQARSAIEGLPVLREIVHSAGRRFQVIAAAGINHQNVAAVINTGVDAVHLSARILRQTSDALGFGAASDFDADKLTRVMQKISLPHSPVV